MTTDDTGQSDPAGLPVTGDGEQLPGELLGQPQDREPELDAYGLPVQYQPAKNRDNGAMSKRFAIACLILGAVSAGLAITYLVSHHKLAGQFAGVGGIAGLLAAFLAFFPGVNFWKKNIPGLTIIVGGILGLIGMTIFWWPAITSS
jgi:hypothetical protein